MVEQPQQSSEMLGVPQEERRIFDRLLSRFPAKFKDARNGFGTDVYLRDASAGGVKITTKERLYLNDSVALEVELPDGKPPMTIRGEVAWLKDKGADMWDAGVRFHKVVLMDLWRIQRLIEDGATA